MSGVVETARELAPGGKLGELVRRLQSEGARSPMIVGHEPDLSHLVERLTGEPMSVAMDKAMVVALEVDGEGPATVRFILDPRSLTCVEGAFRATSNA